MNAHVKARPFLKWAGGKRWLAETIAPLLATKEGRYIEPFLGGGSVFFGVDCDRARLTDVNEELINAYCVVRDQPHELITLLRSLWVDKDLFMHIRREPCVTKVARAARMLYLNRTGFNGLYRVNRRGEFNVPFGCKPGTQTVDEQGLLDCSLKLASADMATADFRSALAEIATDDTVFIDPPYTVKHDNNGFRRYNERIFSWDDQVVLAATANRLAAADVRLVVTNAAHAEVMALYSQRLFRRYVANRATNMAANSAARGVCTEAVLLSISAAESWRRVKGERSEPNRLISEM